MKEKKKREKKGKRRRGGREGKREGGDAQVTNLTCFTIFSYFYEKFSHISIEQSGQIIFSFGM